MTVKHMGLDLNEWIDKGRASGAISNVLTVIWAYCIEEAEALRWVASIVGNDVPEVEALVALQDDWRKTVKLQEIDWYSLRPPS